MDFNPNNIGIANGNYFALPYTAEESEIVLLSVPWDVTTSYRAGTHKGPKAMIDASCQIDLFDPLVPNAWEIAIGTLPPIRGIGSKNRNIRKTAEEVITALEQEQPPASYARALSLVNDACTTLNQTVYQTTRAQLAKGKLVGIAGGEHSVPLGLIRALCDHYPKFGILHIDAHADLRCAYEGFLYSHASIMYNALQSPNITTLVQVGIRDFCGDEVDLIQSRSSIHCFTDELIHRHLFEGATWRQLCVQMIEKLPDHVYISFDIDGLTPDHCPNTGTPVPGGLTFREADYLLHTLALSGKKIIGFDLCEVAPGKNDEWDANVGARLLYKLCCYCHLNGCK
ncbi:MAG: agmatinase family protein [Bacteroidales bacterium]|nr:agmatinase family protein [Bacteroidales bacterium]